MPLPLVELLDEFQSSLKNKTVRSCFKSEQNSGHLSVYLNAYEWRLIDVLHQDFPKLHQMLGDEPFTEMLIKYLQTHPSEHFSIRYLGQHLIHFLTHTPPYAKHQMLAEMACFEWSLAETLDAADDDCLDIMDLQRFPPEHWPAMKLRFHPSLRTHAFNWPIPNLWKTLEQDTEAVVSPPKANAKPVTWVLWRKKLQSAFSSCKPMEFFALDCMQQGSCFAELCERLSAWEDNAEQIPQHTVRFLQHWFQEGMVSAITAES